MDLCHVIYNSAASVPFDEAALVELLEVARNNNAALDVTGMLLYNDGCFFQVLEGPTNAVRELVQKIEGDPRHTQLTVIIDEPIHQRSFAEWTMGFGHISSVELANIEGLNDFFDGQRILTDVDAGRAKKLLAAFGQGRWRVRIANHRPAFEPIAAAETLPQRPSFGVAFQPIVDSSARRVFAHEAQIVGPDGESGTEVLQRIALAEVDEFDADARRTAIAHAARLGLSTSLMLNFVPRRAGTVAGHMASLIDTGERCGIAPHRLVIAMNHEAMAIDPIAIGEAMSAARAQGVRIAIASFGTGHAGYALIEHYQPDAIMLSPWLVADIATNGPRQAIVRGLMQTCNDLGVDVVAQGTETADSFQWLVDEGVTLFQGDLFAPAAVDALPTPMLPIG